jgi:hypothetical protein
MGNLWNIRQVDGAAMVQQFLELGDRLYAGDPEYIRPLDEDIEGIFDRSFNVHFEQGDACRWLLFDAQGQVQGRVAAFYTLNSDGITRQGAMGFFECCNNKAAAFLLFDTCAQWLKERGCTYMDGPVNFGDRDSFWGLMVAGFKNPAYRENYNPPFYQDFFESYGFEMIIGQQTSEIDQATFNAERFGKLSSRVFNNPRYTFKHFLWSQSRAFASDFVTIYNQAWAHHENFRPMTEGKMRMHLRKLKPIMLQEYAWFVYADGEPVGFYINVIDVNQVFRRLKLKGRLTLWDKLRFLWHRRKVTRLRGIIFGIVPKFQNLGLETGLIMKLREQALKEQRFVSSELAWIGDFNPKMLSMLESLGCRTIKVHNTYRKQL